MPEPTSKEWQSGFKDAKEIIAFILESKGLDNRLDEAQKEFIKRCAQSIRDISVPKFKR